MKRIKTAGNLPNPIRKFGLFSKEMQPMWEAFGYPEIYECANVEELGKAGHLDDCEFQVLIDKEVARYYLVAMSIDPDRLKAKIVDTKHGQELVEDESDKPTTIVYYTEITSEQYRIWRKEDYNNRVNHTRASQWIRLGGNTNNKLLL